MLSSFSHTVFKINSIPCNAIRLISPFSKTISNAKHHPHHYNTSPPAYFSGASGNLSIAYFPLATLKMGTG
jgi:hypothetical protein